MLKALLTSALITTLAVMASPAAGNSELEAEISAVRAEIQSANSAAAQFSGGVLLAETQLRIAILSNTLAMLEQKRLAVENNIALTYQDTIPRSSSSIDGAEQTELAKAKADAEAAHEEAAHYTGGMLQAMALIREATAHVTIAAIEQREALAKIGIPAPAPPQTAARSTAVAPGRVTTDSDALR